MQQACKSRWLQKLEEAWDWLGHVKLSYSPRENQLLTILAQGALLHGLI